ncbi:hypothetical protein B0H19DRAFT_1185754 [Mycena capillaripes]|nr:hypothetical protein B0H19DRAFT_1185754 [Mycena capillaripes]
MLVCMLLVSERQKDGVMVGVVLVAEAGDVAVRGQAKSGMCLLSQVETGRRRCGHYSR